MTTRRKTPLLSFALLTTGMLLWAGLPSVVQGQAQHQVGETEMHAHAKSEPSTTLTVTGLDGKTATYNPADLKALTHKSITVYNEHAKANETYSGVPLIDLLAKANVPTGAALRGKLFLLYVVAEGTDHYRVVYSLDETDPVNHAGDVIVADTLNGVTLTTDGAFKLVSSEDKRPARWVRNLTVVTVKSAE